MQAVTCFFQRVREVRARRRALSAALLHRCRHPVLTRASERAEGRLVPLYDIDYVAPFGRSGPRAQVTAVDEFEHERGVCCDTGGDELHAAVPVHDGVDDGGSGAKRTDDHGGGGGACDDEAGGGCAAMLQCDVKGRVPTGIACRGRHMEQVEYHCAYFHVVGRCCGSGGRVCVKGGHTEKNAVRHAVHCQFCDGISLTCIVQQCPVVAVRTGTRMTTDCASSGFCVGIIVVAIMSTFELPSCSLQKRVQRVQAA
jgi:hypothetical protein